jgi:hypothetical protein
MTKRAKAATPPLSPLPRPLLVVDDSSTMRKMMVM